MTNEMGSGQTPCGCVSKNASPHHHVISGICAELLTHAAVHGHGTT